MGIFVDRFLFELISDDVIEFVFWWMFYGVLMIDALHFNSKWDIIFLIRV